MLRSTHQLRKNLVLHDGLGQVIAVVCQATKSYGRGLLDTAVHTVISSCKNHFEQEHIAFIAGRKALPWNVVEQQGPQQGHCSSLHQGLNVLHMRAHMS